jgi:hypothetical protein
MGTQDPTLSGAFFRDVVEGKYEEYAGLGGRFISQENYNTGTRYTI